MPRYYLLLLATALPFAVLCQQSKDKLITFGKVDKAELLQTTCDFDKDAEAIVLSDVGNFYFDIRGGASYQELERHVCIKILKDKGLDQANITIPFRSYQNIEQITGLTANTYNINDSGNIVVTKLDKKLVYEKKLNSRYSEQTFTFPSVKAGSVLEYKYVLKGAETRDWYLQQSIPVRYSSYEMDFPALFEIHLRPVCSLPYDTKDRSTGLRTVKRFSMSNVPALKNEQYITCDEDYLQKIESWLVAVNLEGRRYSVLKSWKEVAKDLLEDEDFGIQLKREIPRTADLDLELKNLKDSYSKMLAVHRYVRKNMYWDGIDNIWAINGVRSAWKEKSGTSGEINLILVNLLKDAGINAYPVMVSTRDNGRITTTFPSIYQFNKVMAFVKLNDRVYVLDGADKYTPSKLIPQDVMYTEGMVIDAANENNFHWEPLWDPGKLNKNVVIFQAVIDEKGQMSGHATISSQDYARTRRAPYLKEGIDKYTDRFYRSEKINIQIDSMHIKNGDVDSLPLEQDFLFHLPVEASGAYSYFTANLFAGLGSNPLISDERFSDVFFGTNQSHTIIANIRIPDNYTFDELPKNIRLTLKDKSLVVTRMLSSGNNMLNARITLEYTRPYYTAEEYPDLKEFYKKMFALLDEQFVIKKKND